MDTGNNFNQSKRSFNSNNGFPSIQKGQKLSQRQHDTLLKLNRSFVGQNIEKLDEKEMFSPPNITAFKQKEIGSKGTLFNTANERITTD